MFPAGEIMIFALKAAEINRGNQEVGKKKHLIGLQVATENYQILWFKIPQIVMGDGQVQ